MVVALNDTAVPRRARCFYDRLLRVGAIDPSGSMRVYGGETCYRPERGGFS